MARVCHTNNCPVGVASQREELRARFPGAPGDLVPILYCNCFLPILFLLLLEPNPFLNAVGPYVVFTSRRIADLIHLTLSFLLVIAYVRD